MPVKVFISSHFQENCSQDKIEELISRFRAYKETGIPHPSFGRDTTYDFPSKVKQAGMYHLHIKDASSKKWHLKSISYHKTSDTALIYCEGFWHKNYYLLLGFIENAHEIYREKPLFLLELSDIADNFRKKF